MGFESLERLSKIILLSLVVMHLSYFTADHALADEYERIRQEANVYRQITEAAFLQQRVLDYNEKKYGKDSVETLKSLEALAWMYNELSNYRDAGNFYLRAINIRKNKMPP